MNKLSVLWSLPFERNITDHDANLVEAELGLRIWYLGAINQDEYLMGSKILYPQEGDAQDWRKSYDEGATTLRAVRRYRDEREVLPGFNLELHSTRYDEDPARWEELREHAVAVLGRLAASTGRHPYVPMAYRW
jgi:hypothetical protein